MVGLLLYMKPRMEGMISEFFSQEISVIENILTKEFADERFFHSTSKIHPESISRENSTICISTLIIWFPRLPVFVNAIQTSVYWSIGPFPCPFLDDVRISYPGFWDISKGSHVHELFFSNSQPKRPHHRCALLRE